MAGGSALRNVSLKKRERERDFLLLLFSSDDVFVRDFEFLVGGLRDFL